MEGIVSGILVGLVLISCSIGKTPIESTNDSIIENEEIISDKNPTSSEQTNANVRIVVMQYHPYCGGAAPDPEQLNDYSNYSGELIVVKLSDNSKSTLKSNQGEYLAFLSPGKYIVKEKYKDVPFKEFITTHRRTGTYYMDESDECYEKWWKSSLISFEIINSDTLINLETTISSSCFTGINPCIQYTGPYPP